MDNLRETGFRFLITFENQGERPLPASGWELYFNMMRLLDTEQVPAPVRVEHINGDFYRITPSAEFKELEPGRRLVVPLDAIAIKRGDAPSGFYFMVNGQPMPLAGVDVAPFVHGGTPAGGRVPGRCPRIGDRCQPEGLGRARAAGWHALRVDDDLGAESYTLAIEPGRGVEIVGGDAAGVFYGIQSLRMLLPVAAYARPQSPIELRAVRVDDEPRLRYRGMHLDVSRNFQPAESVRRLLDMMSFYKLNHFHFHLTDDDGWRLEIAGLPELTAVGGRRGHTLDEREHLIPSFGSGNGTPCICQSSRSFRSCPPSPS